MEDSLLKSYSCYRDISVFKGKFFNHRNPNIFVYCSELIKNCFFATRKYLCTKPAD